MEKPWHMINPNIPASGQKSELLSESSNFRPAERRLTVQRPRRSCQCSFFLVSRQPLPFQESFFPCLCAFCGSFLSYFQALNDPQQVFFFCREYRSKIENHPALFNSDNHWRIRTAKTLFQ